MLADGTDKVIRQFLSYVLIAADATAPDGLALGGLTHRLGLRFDMLLRIIIGGRRCIGEDFHLSDRPYEKHVCAEVDRLLNVNRYKSVGTSRDGQCAVSDATTISKVVKLIDRPSALEAEMLKQIEVGSLAEN